MDNKKLADLLFPNNKFTVEEIEKKYPKRNLKEGAEVTRFAPSPTGFMHIGTVWTAMTDERIAHKDNGIFYTHLLFIVLEFKCIEILFY